MYIKPIFISSMMCNIRVFGFPWIRGMSSEATLIVVFVGIVLLIFSKIIEVSEYFKSIKSKDQTLLFWSPLQLLNGKLEYSWRNPIKQDLFLLLSRIYLFISAALNFIWILGKQHTAKEGRENWIRRSHGIVIWPN